VIGQEAWVVAAGELRARSECNSTGLRSGRCRHAISTALTQSGDERRELRFTRTGNLTGNEQGTIRVGNRELKQAHMAAVDRRNEPSKWPIAATFANANATAMARQIA
jgi:hypothetical protein